MRSHESDSHSPTAKNKRSPRARRPPSTPSSPPGSPRTLQRDEPGPARETPTRHLPDLNASGCPVLEGRRGRGTGPPFARKRQRARETTDDRLRVHLPSRNRGRARFAQVGRAAANCRIPYSARRFNLRTRQGAAASAGNLTPSQGMPRADRGARLVASIAVTSVSQTRPDAGAHRRATQQNVAPDLHDPARFARAQARTREPRRDA
jgi:hypothetical protein